MAERRRSRVAIYTQAPTPFEDQEEGLTGRVLTPHNEGQKADERKQYTPMHHKKFVEKPSIQKKRFIFAIRLQKYKIFFT